MSFVPPSRFILPRYFQSRYRRHLFNFKLPFQLPLARRSLNQLSRLRIHLVQEFEIGSIQFTHHMLLHDIATRAATQQRLSEQTPQRQRGFILALFSRRHDGLVHQIVFLCDVKRYLVLKTEVSHSCFPDQNLFFFQF